MCRGYSEDLKNLVLECDLRALVSIEEKETKIRKDYSDKGLKLDDEASIFLTQGGFAATLRADPATTYKYKLKDYENTYILAWSTTPWNKIVTPALAVNPALFYVKIKVKDENYILAKTTLKILKKEKYKIIEDFKGSELVGKKFVPHYDFYKIDEEKKAFVIIPGDFVTAEEGIGVVTIAAYGEEDLKASLENNIHIEMHVDEEGTIKKDVPQFGGMYYLKANKYVNEDLGKSYYNDYQCGPQIRLKHYQKKNNTQGNKI